MSRRRLRRWVLSRHSLAAVVVVLLVMQFVVAIRGGVTLYSNDWRTSGMSRGVGLRTERAGVVLHVSEWPVLIVESYHFGPSGWLPCVWSHQLSNGLARGVYVPLAPVTAFPTLAAGALYARAYVRKRRLADRTTCPACGYTLAGLPTEGPCPECGRAQD